MECVRDIGSHIAGRPCTLKRYSDSSRGFFSCNRNRDAHRERRSLRRLQSKRYSQQAGTFEGMRITWKQGHSALGTVTMQSGSDGSIDFYTEVVFDKQDIQGSGRYVVTGGTGRFHGATGSGTFNVGPLQDGTRPLTWRGTLSY